MAKANISSWRTEVAYHVKGPDSTLTDWAVVEALRDFCRHTGLWRYELDRISTVIDTATYAFTDIDKDGANVLDSIVWAKYKANGEADDQFSDMWVIEGDWEEKIRQAAWSFQDASEPHAIMVDHYTGGTAGSRVESEKVFRVYPIPTVASTSGLLIKVQVKPAIGATSVPGIFWNDYHKVITHGAVSILQNMTNKPWSNKDHAKDNWNQYKAGRSNGAADRRYGRSTRSMKVIPRFDAGSRRVGGYRSEKRF